MKATKKNKTKTLRVPYKRGGKRERVDVEVPDGGEPDDVVKADASKFVQTLEDNKQISHGPGPLSRGATHQIEQRPDGTKRLTRKRFSAL